MTVENVDDTLQKMRTLEAAFIAFAAAYRESNGCLPVVLCHEGYRHMGNRVEITAANVYDPPKGAEVTISNRCGEYATVDLAELSVFRVPS
jgi:hypothetical protein